MACVCLFGLLLVDSGCLFDLLDCYTVFCWFWVDCLIVVLVLFWFDWCCIVLVACVLMPFCSLA